MKTPHSDPERLLRLLDNRLSGAERSAVEAELRSDPVARAALRELAEHAVAVADLERAASLHPREGFRRPAPARPRRRWLWGLAAAACIALAWSAAALRFRNTDREFGRVVKVTGASGSFGARGAAPEEITAGVRLHPGDTLEIPSADSWIELELRDGSRMTVAGQTALRVLEEDSGSLRLSLNYGSLWVTPVTNASPQRLVIQTPAAALTAHGAQFDLHACSTETTTRINGGDARVRLNVDGSELTVPAGSQAVASLDQNEPLTARPQPPPVNAWKCDLGTAPEIILGRWLPPSAEERARLGAEPLLWPPGGRDPVLLHAVALSVLRSSARPVVLQPGSKLVFRGRTARPQTVRFGFSTQRMRGVFAGKFEVDVRPEDLGPRGETWTVTLPLADFRPLHPHLSPSPEGLELNDVYALTVRENAGLELHHIELVPPSPAQ